MPRTRAPRAVARVAHDWRLTATPPPQSAHGNSSARDWQPQGHCTSTTSATHEDPTSTRENRVVGLGDSACERGANTQLTTRRRARAACPLRIRPPDRTHGDACFARINATYHL